jgi:hypothetical protein
VKFCPFPPWEGKEGWGGSDRGNKGNTPFFVNLYLRELGDS